MQLYSLGGLLVGMLVGTILAIWAAKKKQNDLALIGFCCCVFFGSIGGLIFIIPIVAIFLWLIWKANNKSKQGSVNESNTTETDNFYDEVARELQEKTLVAGLWTKAFAEMGKSNKQHQEEQTEPSKPDKQIAITPTKSKTGKILAVLAGAIIVIVILANSGSNSTSSSSTPTDIVSQQKELAEKGDADAANSLGLFYYCGDGVAKDYAEAFKWFSKAADQNNLDAQSSLGDCYHYGRGVAKDEAEAVKWYRKSAEQGYSEAQWDLGFCYENGEGVAKNMVIACKWYSLAAAQGFEYAKTNLSIVESQMTSEQITQAQILSAYFVPKGVSPKH
jgi:hypothetical protein